MLRRLFIASVLVPEVRTTAYTLAFEHKELVLR